MKYAKLLFTWIAPLSIMIILSMYQYFFIRSNFSYTLTAFGLLLVGNKINYEFLKIYIYYRNNKEFNFKGYFVCALLYIPTNIIIMEYMKILSFSSSFKVMDFIIYGLAYWLYLIGLTKMFTMKSNDSETSSYLNKNDITSYLNPKTIIRGFKWTPFKEVVSKLNEGINIDTFEVVEKPERLNSKQKKELSETYIKFKPLYLTKGLVAIGKAGSGKTEYFFNFANENKTFKHFKRELYHDVKGDFTQKLYNPERDFILNPFDNRGFVWDIWKDMQFNEQLIMSFVSNLLNALTGESKDKYWVNSAIELFSEILLKVHYKHHNLGTNEKFDKLLEALESKKTIIDAKNISGGEADVWNNLKLCLEWFYILAFIGKQQQTKPFSIYEWVEMKNTRLFLLNNASYSTKLNPFFTGFLSSLFQVMLSKADIDEDNPDLTLMILDEYLALKIDDDARLKLLTQIRSKGACPILGVQLIPADEMKQKQLMSSSTFAKVIFNVEDDETVATFVRSFGQVEYEHEKVNASVSTAKSSIKTNDDEFSSFMVGTGLMGRSKTSTNYSYSTEDKNRSFITESIIKTISDYRHITFIGEKNVFYSGYTPRVKFEKKNSHFEKRDLTPYYHWLFKIDHNEESERKIRFKDIDESKEEIQVNEEISDEELLEYKTEQLLKKSFTVKLEIYNELDRAISSRDNDEMIDVINKFGLSCVDIDRFIAEFEEELEELDRLNEEKETK